MKEFDVFFDVADNWEDDNIDVFQTTVKAKSVKQAYEKALQNVEEGIYDEFIQGRLWYLWDITEQDEIEKQ